MGVCLHPKYGGWFAMRSVFVFKNYHYDKNQLQQVEPLDSLDADIEKIKDILIKFNYNWRDSRYRDVIKVEEKYSDIQREYFETSPKLRKDLIRTWLRFKDQNQLVNSYKIKNIYLTNRKAYLINNFYLE